MLSELRKLFFVLQKCLCELASQRCKSAALPSLRGCHRVTVTCPCARGYVGQRVMGDALQPVGKSIQTLIHNRHLLLPSWTFLKGDSWSSHRENKCPVKPPAQQINCSNIKGRYGTESRAPVISFNNTPKPPT